MSALIRLRYVSALAVLAVAVCAGAAAAPKEEVELVTTTLPTLNPGQTAWVSTLWRGTSQDVMSAFEPIRFLQTIERERCTLTMG